MISRINELYDKVFDRNGEVTNCGRLACMNLIEACEEFTYSISGTHGNYGNVETGVMNVPNIKQLMRAIN